MVGLRGKQPLFYRAFHSDEATLLGLSKLDKKKTSGKLSQISKDAKLY